MKYLFIFIVLSFSCVLSAEIHRETTVCNESGEMCFYWWPKLPRIEGWQQDNRNSYRYSLNAQAPVGFNFGNAESVIYAKAIYKLREPDTKSLEQFITNDKNRFLKTNPELSIKEILALTSKSGLKFRCYSFIPKINGNWERASYSEEKDADGNEYYLVFVLSSRTEKAYKSSMVTYEKFVTEYE